MTASATATPDLATRLAESRAAELPHRERVAGLELELHQAVGSGDYATAAVAQRELPAARQALVIAQASTHSLEAGERLIAESEAAEREAIEAQRRRDEARARLPLHQAAEDEGGAALDQLRERIHDQLRTLQRSMREITAIEQAIGRARARIAEDLVACGDRPGPVTIPPAPNRLSAIVANHPLLRQIRDWSGQ
jgi:hypothetical protein